MNSSRTTILAAAFLAAGWLAQAEETVAPVGPASLAVPLNEALRAELIAMAGEDQRVRQETGPAVTSAQIEEMRVVDARNGRRMQEIVAQYGWPIKSLVGKDGAQRAWLLVQHCDFEFQEKCLPLLERAVAAGEAAGRNYAYLLDRVLMRRGKPQVYGTQYRTINGKMAVYPIDDPEHLDERRKAVELGSWAEYDQRMRKPDEETQPKVKDPALRQQIFRMAAENTRVHHTRATDKTEADQKEALAIDAANLAQLKEILAKHGWPGDSLVGADAARSVFTLVTRQGNPAFRAGCLPLLEKAWKEGEAGAQEYAGLVDLVRVAQGQLSLYGVFVPQKDGRADSFLVEDPKHLDERRKAIGLGPLVP